jgi:hypothetical protein
MLILALSVPLVAADGTIEATMDGDKQEWETRAQDRSMASDYRTIGSMISVNLFGIKPDSRSLKESLTIDFTYTEQGDVRQVSNAGLRFMPTASMMKPFYTSIKDDRPTVTVEEMKKEGDLFYIKGNFRGTLYRVENPMKAEEPDLEDTIAIEGTFESRVGEVK